MGFLHFRALLRERKVSLVSQTDALNINPTLSSD